MKRFILKAFIVFICVFSFNTISAEASLNSNNSSVRDNGLSYDADDNQRVVNVGYFYFDGYHMMDDSGKMSGYGFELVEQLKMHSDFETEYVGYENNVSDMLEMLRNGEVDLLTDVRYTEERAEEFLFSQYDVGLTSYCLFVRSDEERFVLGDYNTYRGIKVGVMNNDYSVNPFIEYAKEKRFSYKIVYYPDEETMHNALSLGDIDAIVSNNYRIRIIDYDEKVFDSFADEYVYAVTRKDDYKLMEKIDQAILSVQYYNPTFFGDLFSKYYSNNLSKRANFTRAENEYIKQTQDNPVSFIVLSDAYPMAYYKDGEVCGILPDYLEKLSNNIGLKYTLTGYDDREGYFEVINNKSADACLDVALDYNVGRTYNFRFTKPYISVPMTEVYFNHKKGNGKTAVLPSMSSPEKSDEQLQFSTVKDCLHALKDGVCSSALVPLYSAQNFCRENKKFKFDKNHENSYYIDLSMAVMGEDSAILSSILSKAISEISDKELQSIISTHLLDDNSGFVVLTYIKSRPALIWLICCVIFIVVSSIIILGIRSKRSNYERELSEQNLLLFKTGLSAYLFALEFVKQRNDWRIRYYRLDVVDGGSEVYTSDLTKSEFRQYLDRVHPDDFEEVSLLFNDESIKDISDHDKSLYREIRMLDKEGNYRYMALSLQAMVALKDDNVRMLALVKDIDNVKREEEEKRKTLSMALETAKKFNESKMLFLSQMSHDIRTPMNAIMGMATIAQLNFDDTEKVKSCLSTIENSSEHLLTLINDILDVSKIESGHLSFNHERVSLRDSLENSVFMLKQKINHKNLKVTVDVDSLSHDCVMSDPTRLEQVFTNIISNAVKYTQPGGSVDISLVEKESSKANTFLYDFSVKDTGIGMSEETLGKLFRPFERAKAVEFVEGAGLGMSITKSIVDALGGLINVESKEGVGTKVSVSLYFNNDTNQSLEVYKELKGKNAAIITPDPKLKEMLTAIFEEGRMYVDSYKEYSSFIKAVSQEDSRRYSVVVMSMLFPMMDEISALKSVRMALGDDAVLVDITSEDISIVRNWTYDFAFDGFIPSPCYKLNVIRVIGDAVENRRENVKKTIVATGNGRHALIVEDVEINAMFAEAIVEMKGFAPEIASNGQEASEKLENSEDGYYSIVLMDIQMPVMNGYEATRRIRSSEREYLKNIPIIAMSANAFEEDVLKSLDAGMNDHIAKPVDIYRFSEIVDKYIKD